MEKWLSLLAYFVVPQCLWWLAIAPDSVGWRFATACGSFVIFASQVMAFVLSPIPWKRPPK